MRLSKTGSVKPLPRSGNRTHQKLFEHHIKAIERWLEDEPVLYLYELADKLKTEFDVSVDRSLICRVLGRRGFNRKKVVYAHQLDQPHIQGERAAWRRILNILMLTHLCRLVFVDETGLKTHMCRKYARSKGGRRIRQGLKYKSKSYTQIGAMGLCGMIAKHLVPGAMNQDRLEQWVTDVLIPQLPEGSWVIWDAHKAPAVRYLFYLAKVPLLFQARYSPDINPIEQAWTRLKTLVRGRRPRGAQQLREALDWAWGKIDNLDICNFFEHAGLVVASPISVN